MSRTIVVLAACTLVGVCFGPGSARASSIALTDNAGNLVRWNISKVPYYLNPAGSADVKDGTDIAAIAESFSDWVDLPCSHIQAVELGEAGDTSLLTGAQPNGKSELHWVETSKWGYGKYVLGVTAPLYGYNGFIVEADIAFNGYLQKWSTKGSWGAVDVKSIAVHEIGHLFGIQHNLGGYSQSSPPTMATAWDGSLKQRSLEKDDKSSFCFLYDHDAYTCASDNDCPYVVANKANGEEYYAAKYTCKSGKCELAGGSMPEGTKGLGEQCSTDQDCKGDYFCQPVWGQGSFCTQLCQPGNVATCPASFACQPYDGVNYGACVPTGPVSKPKGAACEASSECVTGLCATNPLSGELSCRKTCTQTEGQCGASEICVPGITGTASGACWPKVDIGDVNLPDTYDCQFDWQCLSGRCVLDETGASACRAACDPGAPSCAAGTWCVELTPGVGACVPGEPPPPETKLEDGAICKEDDACESGMCFKHLGSPKAFCQRPCSLSDDTCPEGTVCTGFGSAADGMCMKIAAPAGDPCTEREQCTTHLCVDDEGGGVCAQECSDPGICPCGTVCQQLDGLGGVCTPDPAAEGCVEDGGPCATNLSCAGGRCIGGVCGGEPASVDPGVDAGDGAGADAGAQGGSDGGATGGVDSVGGGSAGGGGGDAGSGGCASAPGGSSGAWLALAFVLLWVRRGRRVAA